ncbi:hypothetical protein ACRALDRAFT_1092962 [Sodiomyces alcalophilus JCM 7366]|uniref:uncharacterized protein n=1 Tax=Sodiomyces alcalophilus JCM 7366 TaxID=591952 RepID=UPI0039B378D4
MLQQFLIPYSKTGQFPWSGIKHHKRTNIYCRKEPCSLRFANTLFPNLSVLAKSILISPIHQLSAEEEAWGRKMAKDSSKKEKPTVSKSDTADPQGRHVGSAGNFQDSPVPSMEIKRLAKSDRKELDRKTTELVESRNALASELAKWADRPAYAPTALMSQSAELHLREMRHLQKLTKKLGEAELLYRIRPGTKENNAWDFIRNLAAQFRTHLGPRLGDGLSHDDESTCPSDGADNFSDDPAIDEVPSANGKGNTSVGDEYQDAKRKRTEDSGVPSKKSKLRADMSSSPRNRDEYSIAHSQSEISDLETTEPSVLMRLGSPDLAASAAGSPMDAASISPEKKSTWDKPQINVERSVTDSENEKAKDGLHVKRKGTKKKKKYGEKEGKAHKKKSKKKKAKTTHDAAGDDQKGDSDVEMHSVDDGHREAELEEEKTAKDQGKKKRLKSDISAKDGPQEPRADKDDIVSSTGVQRMSTTAIPVPDYRRSSPATASTPTKLRPCVKDPSAFSGGNRRWEPYFRPHTPLFSSKELGQQNATTTTGSRTPFDSKRKDEQQLTKSSDKRSVAMAIGPVDELHVDNEEMTSPIEAHVKNRRKVGRPKGSKSRDKDAAAATPTAAQIPSSAGGSEDLVRPLTPSSRAIDKFAIDDRDAERKRAKLQDLLRRDYEVLSQERKEWFRVMNFEQR